MLDSSPRLFVRSALAVVGCAVLCGIVGASVFGAEGTLSATPDGSSQDKGKEPAERPDPAPKGLENLLPPPKEMVPAPNDQTKQRFARYVERLVDPDNTLDLVINRSRLIVLKDAPKRISLSDDTIAATAVVSPKELSIIGRKVGTTVLTLWFVDAADPTKEVILSYLVRVVPDPELKARTDRVYDALADEINRAFPDSVIKLRTVGDKLLVTGEAKDIQEAFQILSIVRGSGPQTANNPAIIPVGQLNLNLPPEALANPESAADGEASIRNFLLAGGTNIINQIRVAGEQQVMLRVTVAEVNRAAARSIGINFTVTSGGFSIAQLTGSLFGGIGGGGGGGIGGGGGGGAGMGASLNNLPISFNGGQVALAINALKSLNLARSLAEPNLTTLNGHPASFRAGGEFPVPVVTGATATGLQGVQFVPFGVSLQFTPIITDGNRIRLTLNSTVSNRDAATAQTSINGAGVSSLNTRNFSSTVELREGQTLAVAGLIQNNLGSDATRVPFLGDIPVLGRLFAFDRTSSGDQELIVLVTPELVHPLDKNELPACLPGDHLVSPTDVEFYLHGRLLSRKPAPVYPATYPTGSIRGFMTGPLVGPAPAAPVTAVGGVKPASLATAAPAAAPDPRKLREVERRLLIGSSGFAESR